MLNCQVETFIWLFLGLLLIGLRLGVRVWLLGSFRSWRIDDYLMILVGILFILEALLSFFVYNLGTNNMKESVRESLTSAEIRRREMGAKLLYAGWFVYFLLLWSLKWAMIEFYKRLSLGRKVYMCLRILSWLVALSAVGVVFTLTFTCWPIQHNWQVLPDPGVKCTEDWAYFAVTGLPNILTEFALLCIPITVLFRIRISLRQKIPLFILFGLGGLIIATTALRHVSIFRDIYDSKLVTIWGTREAFASIFVGNAPQLKPLYDLCYDKITGHSPSELSSQDDEEDREGEEEDMRRSRPKSRTVSESRSVSESRPRSKSRTRSMISRMSRARSVSRAPSEFGDEEKGKLSESTSRLSTPIPLPSHMSLYIRPFSPFVLTDPLRNSTDRLIIPTKTSLDVSFSRSTSRSEMETAEEVDNNPEFGKFRFFDRNSGIQRPPSSLKL